MVTFLLIFLTILHALFITLWLVTWQAFITHYYPVVGDMTGFHRSLLLCGWWHDELSSLFITLWLMTWRDFITLLYPVVDDMTSVHHSLLSCGWWHEELSSLFITLWLMTWRPFITLYYLVVDDMVILRILESSQMNKFQIRQKLCFLAVRKICIIIHYLHFLQLFIINLNKFIWVYTVILLIRFRCRFQVYQVR